MNKWLIIGIVLLLVVSFTGCTILNSPNNNGNPDNENAPNENEIPLPDANTGGDEPTQLPF